MDFRTHKKSKPKATFKQYCSILLKVCEAITRLSVCVDVTPVVKAIEGLQKAEEGKKKVKLIHDKGGEA